MIDVVIGKRQNAADWKSTVTRMAGYGLDMSVEEIEQLTDYLTETQGLTPVKARRKPRRARTHDVLKQKSREKPMSKAVDDLHRGPDAAGGGVPPLGAGRRRRRGLRVRGSDAVARRRRDGMRAR